MKAVNEIKDEGDENDDNNGDQGVVIHVFEPSLTLQLSRHHMHRCQASWKDERRPSITVL
jgi:hypothetical protein